VQLFGTKGQKFFPCPGTKGQRDKLKILPWDEQDFDSLSRPVPGHPAGQKLKKKRWKNGNFFYDFLF
jgi:hypothetical protein